MAPAAKESRWNLRVASDQDLTVKRAAALLQSNPTEFIRTAAVTEAERVLMDQTAFQLDGDEWDRFVEVLDRPPAVPVGLEELFSKPSVFE